MENKYRKCIKLSSLKHSKRDILRLENIILRLGYIVNVDYRLVTFNESTELIITNQELHRDLKTVRRTRYGK